MLPKRCLALAPGCPNTSSVDMGAQTFPQASSFPSSVLPMCPAESRRSALERVQPGGASTNDGALMQIAHIAVQDPAFGHSMMGDAQEIIIWLAEEMQDNTKSIRLLD